MYPKVLFILLLLVGLPSEQNRAMDFRFILQTEAGITAYTQVEEPISLPHARQLFSSVFVETADYIYGEYVLAGQTNSVNLAVGREGWVIAFHPKDYITARWMDCSQVSRPERAVLQVAGALGENEPALGFYDNRYPEATAVFIHWLYISNSGTQNASLNLPLSNLYLDRGYNFCTALTNSEFYLNSQRLEAVGSLYEVVRRWKGLGSEQLRAGQLNYLRIEAFSIFGTGFFTGVVSVYQGDEEITNTGGTLRKLELAYPEMLGVPLDVTTYYLPVVSR